MTREISRSRVKDRCDRCLLRRVLCACSLIPSLRLKTRLSVLMHWREIETTSNTGRVACLAIAGSRIHVRGRRGSTLPSDEILKTSEQALLLFPTESSTELTPSLIESFDRPMHLVVPDGTWRQAKKVAVREKAFKLLPRVHLPAGAPSRYQLRQTPHLRNLSTLEAITRALRILEPDRERELEALEAAFEVIVERILWSRGKLQMHECRHPIPEAALELFRLDGRAGSPAGRLQTLREPSR
jgi:DTW domain-containing protein YfiP